MTYFKILKKGIVVDVGIYFLQWNTKWKQWIYCNTNNAQAVQNYAGSKVYRDNWMRTMPSDADEYEDAEVVMINATEFDALIELLKDGETVIAEAEEIPEDGTKESLDIEDKSELEHRMTVQEIREKLKMQDTKINMLTECLLEMSELVYGGDVV